MSRKEMLISKETLLDVYESLSTDGKAYLVVYNNTMDKIVHDDTDRLLSKDPPGKGYSNIRVKRVPKFGSNSLDSIIDYMTVKSLTFGKVVVENEINEQITCDNTNLLIEFPNLSVNFWPDDPELPPVDCPKGYK